MMSSRGASRIAVLLSAILALVALPVWAATPRVILAEDFSATW